VRIRSAVKGRRKAGGGAVAEERHQPGAGSVDPPRKEAVVYREKPNQAAFVAPSSTPGPTNEGVLTEKPRLQEKSKSSSVFRQTPTKTPGKEAFLLATRL